MAAVMFQRAAKEVRINVSLGDRRFSVRKSIKCCSNYFLCNIVHFVLNALFCRQSDKCVIHKKEALMLDLWKLDLCPYDQERGLSFRNKQGGHLCGVHYTITLYISDHRRIDYSWQKWGLLDIEKPSLILTFFMEEEDKVAFHCIFLR